MNQARQQPPQADFSPPPMQASEPPGIGRGHPEYHFVQAIMELKTTIHQMDTDQKVSMARMEEKMGSMKESVDSTKKKVEDLLKWRFTVGGGLLVVGILIGLIVRFADRITILPKDSPPTTVEPLQNQRQQPQKSRLSTGQ